MRIELNCAVCGKNSFNLGGDRIVDDTRISCEICGHEIGTLAELKERVAAEVLNHAAGRDADGA